MNSTRLRDLIKNKSSEISFEEYRIRYATERFLLRLQKSPYRENFVIKGGFLLGSLFDINNRTTKDLDTLLKEIAADKKNVTAILEDICQIDLNDQVQFELLNLLDTQQERAYDGFQAKLVMSFLEESSMIHFDLDIGIGDAITPHTRFVAIPLLFNEEKGVPDTIQLQAYPLETILAEKVETILDLGIKNTRMKDFYDVYLILNTPNRSSLINLYRAFKNTWEFRHKNSVIDEELFEDWFFTVDEITENKNMNELYWPNYTKDRTYANHLEFSKITRQLKEFLEYLLQVYQKNQ